MKRKIIITAYLATTIILNFIIITTITNIAIKANYQINNIIITLMFMWALIPLSYASLLTDQITRDTKKQS